MNGLKSFARDRFRILLALMQVVWGGCIHRETNAPYPTQPPPPFSDSGETFTPDRWWTEFGSGELDAQVEQALGGSFVLAAALQRLRAARAVARREASDLWPDVDGIAASDGIFRSGAPDSSSYLLGLDAAWQVDLWGQIESRVDAQRLRAAATQVDYHAIALTLSAEVAGTWFSMIEARAQLELLDEQLETNVTGLELQEARFGLGQVRSGDVLRQRQLVEATREQIVVVKSRIAVLEHLMAVLQGRPPQAAEYTTGAELPALPPLPATGLPSELLQRRPDVRRDFLAFQAADRDLASAVAAQYPRINLTSSIVTAAESPENLFRDWISSISSQLIAPLIDGGQRRAEVDRTAAVKGELFNQYGQTVLIAFQEVEDGLVREQFQIQRLDRLVRQVELGRQASLQLREQYLIGEADYLDVLSAIQQEQRLQRETLSARLELVLIRIGLYLALAGSFDTRPQTILIDQPSEVVLDE